jgi:hypothetical protein
MVRNITGFAIFAFVAMIGFRLLIGVFGWLIGLVMTVLMWALVGFVIYTLLKIFAPGVASKVRETIRGDSATAN